METLSRELRPRKRRAVDLSGTARVKVVLTLPKDIDKAFKVTTKQYLEALKTYGPTIDKEKSTTAAQHRPHLGLKSSAASVDDQK